MSFWSIALIGGVGYFLGKKYSRDGSSYFGRVRSANERMKDKIADGFGDAVTKKFYRAMFGEDWAEYYYADKFFMYGRNPRYYSDNMEELDD